MKRKILILFLILFTLAVVATLFYIFFRSPEETKAWFDENWFYRKAITITNSGSEAVDNKISVNVDTSALVSAGQLQSDCDDLRFTNQWGKLLTYQIISGCNTATTTIEIKVDKIYSSASGNTTIYMYYGNPSASSGQKSFSATSASVSISFGSEEKGPAPVAYFKFDEGSGCTAYDQSSNKNNGTLSPTCSSDSPTWTNGKFGKALSFDGTNDYVSTVDINPALTSTYSNLSWGAWVKPTAGAIASKAIIVKNNEFRLYTDSSGYPVCQIYGSGAWQTALVGNTLLQANVWQNVFCTYDGSNLKIYLNGKEIGSQSLTTALTNQTTTLEIGKDAGGTYGYFNGAIDDVKIYNYRRNAQQILQDFNQGASLRF